MRNCRAKNRKGGQCGAAPIKGSAFCVMHSGRAQELGRLGGCTSRRHSHDLTPLPTPKSVGDLLNIVLESVTELRDDRLDPKTASAMAALANIAAKLFEMHTLEKRIAAIEERDRQTQRCEV
jgi:hypothetical protein